MATTDSFGTIVLPKAYPWVLAVASLTPALLLFQTSAVVKARIAAKIKYPQMYATKEEEQQNPKAKSFNCTQRAHQNTLEQFTSVVFGLLVGGIRAPRTTAIAGAVWIFGRLLYTLGYGTGEPRNRMTGFRVSLAAAMVLFGSSLYTSFTLLQEKSFAF